MELAFEGFGQIKIYLFIDENGRSKQNEINDLFQSGMWTRKLASENTVIHFPT